MSHISIVNFDHVNVGYEMPLGIESERINKLLPPWMLAGGTGVN